jgi:polyphosphate kinase
VVPVTDLKLCARLAEIFEIALADDVLAWELRSDGSWQRVETVNGINAHRRFQELALDRARGNGVVTLIKHA